MNEERENGRFDPADFIPADAQPKAAVSCELEEPPRGSALTGILGALFGALVGVVPWFLASTFADFFVGWLGFLVGVAACWGYRLFKGRRSTRFAMATVIVCSLLALFAAEIASWMYVLCSDPEWQADAAWYGIPVAQLAWESILMPENWGIMAPSMLMGMVIGVLGVVCFCIGMVMSYRFSTPAGASVVVVNLAAFLLFTGAEWALKFRTGGKKPELSENTEAERQQQDG